MRLETSHELLERLRAKNGSSWYALAGVLGAHQKTIANWKNGRTIVDRKFAPRIAELLEEPAEYVLACLEAERESEPEVRKLWQRIAAKFRSHAASILLGGLVLLSGAGAATTAHAAGDPSFDRSIHYAKCRCMHHALT